MSAPERKPVRMLVTVTYGARWHFLRQALESASREGMDRAIVVSNAAHDDVAALAHAQFGSWVTVVRFDRNTGSAGGFKAGIASALEAGADYLLLLDDDNVLAPGCVATLERAHGELAADVDRARLAVLCYRPDRHADVAIGMPAHGMEGNRAAFFGFDLLDLPFKVFRRTPAGRRWIARRRVRPAVAVATAPYSGLYFHRSMAERIGLPDERFLLYADDTEYSYRVTRDGGRIVLVTSAHLSDLEQSWNVRARYSNTLDALLQGDSDFRAFYSTRNNAYFERRQCHAGWTRSLNRGAYLGLLWLRARMTRRRERFALLLRAIRDGEAGRLGEHPEYPI